MKGSPLIRSNIQPPKTPPGQTTRDLEEVQGPEVLEGVYPVELIEVIKHLFWSGHLQDIRRKHGSTKEENSLQ
jgi:hypothetical protein